MGGPTSSYATAGIALRVISLLKPPHYDKVETPWGGDPKHLLNKWLNMIMSHSGGSGFKREEFLMPPPGSEPWQFVL